MKIGLVVMYVHAPQVGLVSTVTLMAISVCQTLVLMEPPVWMGLENIHVTVHQDSLVRKI